MLRMFLLTFIFALPAFAAEPARYDQPYTPWENLKGGAEYIFDSENQKNWIGGTLATVVANHFDQDAEKYLRGKRRFGDFDPIGNEILGTGVPGVLIAGSFWWYGYFNNDAHAAHAGQAHIEALATTGLVSAVIKFAGQRQRPDSSDRHSFPSGHTSTVFASASSLTEFYGWKVGVPAYTLALLTGLGRVSSGRHYLSDVAFGATLGIVFGHAYGRFHLGKVDSPVTLVPVIQEDGAKLVLNYRW